MFSSQRPVSLTELGKSSVPFKAAALVQTYLLDDWTRAAAQPLRGRHQSARGLHSKVPPSDESKYKSSIKGGLRPLHQRNSTSPLFSLRAPGEGAYLTPGMSNMFVSPVQLMSSSWKRTTNQISLYQIRLDQISRQICSQLLSKSLCCCL